MGSATRLCCFAVAIMASAALAQDRPRALLPAATIVERALERFSGEVLDVEEKPPKKDEPADAVYEIKLLSARGDVLKLRFDAMTGAFLEASGEGLMDARRPARKAGPVKAGDAR